MKGREGVGIDDWIEESRGAGEPLGEMADFEFCIGEGNGSWAVPVEMEGFISKTGEALSSLHDGFVGLMGGKWGQSKISRCRISYMLFFWPINRKEAAVCDLSWGFGGIQ